MFEKGIRELTGKDLKASFKLFFEPSDIVGLKVIPSARAHQHPSGARRRHDRLARSQRPASQDIIIWDRFDFMLKDAGFTRRTVPRRGHRGLQTMDEAAAEGKTRTTASG